MRLPRRLRPYREPVPPMTVAGYGRIIDRHLPVSRSRRLAELAGVGAGQWGVLFIVDGRGRQWTLYSPDADYTQMFAPHAHTLSLPPQVFAVKFPVWNAGWDIG